MKNILDFLKRNRLFVYLFILVIGLLSGILIESYLNNRKEIKKTESHENGYSFISPLIECFSSKSDSPENYKLQKKIENLISERINTKKITEASVYFRDLANGPWIGINENEKFTPASLLKVPIMITYYKLAEEDSNILNQELLISSDYDDKNIPNIKPEQKVEIGKSYTVQELINRMIMDSDNIAANTLLSNLQERQISETFTDLGLELPTIEKPENYMTVKDYSSFFRVLYNASYLDKNYSEKALQLLAESKYRQGLVAGLPLNTKISHKFGERKNEDTDQLHDCGIIYKNNKDYLLCVMTRGNDFNKLSNTIKDISELVYENVN